MEAHAKPQSRKENAERRASRMGADAGIFLSREERKEREEMRLRRRVGFLGDYGMVKCGLPDENLHVVGRF